jgi:hypothetical protein
MNTENIIINKGYSDPAKWHSEDTVWVLGLFGTAIGAGVLFLPINAGIGGFWPLLIVFVLAFRLTAVWRDSFTLPIRRKAVLPMLLASILARWREKYLPSSISSPSIPF